MDVPDAIDARHQIAKKSNERLSARPRIIAILLPVPYRAIGRNASQALIQTFFAKDARDVP